jgi:hypothetical protein
MDGRDRGRTCEAVTSNRESSTACTVCCFKRSCDTSLRHGHSALAQPDRLVPSRNAGRSRAHLQARRQRVCAAPTRRHWRHAPCAAASAVMGRNWKMCSSSSSGSVFSIRLSSPCSGRETTRGACLALAGRGRRCRAPLRPAPPAGHAVPCPPAHLLFLVSRPQPDP